MVAFGLIVGAHHVSYVLLGLANLGIADHFLILLLLLDLRSTLTCFLFSLLPWLELEINWIVTDILVFLKIIAERLLYRL